jgi:hypothetical protein
MSHYGVSPVMFESVSAVTATPSVDLGTVVNVGGEQYIYAYAIATVSASVGATISGVSGYSVIATGMISGAFCVGFAKHADIPAGSYGWLLQKGFISSPVNGMVGTAIAATDGIMLAADGKIANAAAAVGGHLVGRSVTAVVSGGTGGSNTGKIFVSVF